MQLIDALRTGDTYTENGMPTNSSTLDSVLDLFYQVPASPRNGFENSDYISKFEKAFSENKTLTKKVLFWMRDVRSGAGERKKFRLLLTHLANTRPNEVKHLIKLIPEYGRWDDLFSLFGTPLEKDAISFIVDSLRNSDNVGLLAKWIPRTGGKVSKENRLISNKIRKAMGLEPKEWRKLLVKNTDVVESKMCAKRFDLISYDKVPSLAMSRNTNAFNKNDYARFSEYKASLIKGEAKINAGALYPYDVLRTLKYGQQDIANQQWNSLPNFLENNKEVILPVCDVSGSMSFGVAGNTTTALDVCISLGLYVSERNLGPFKDAFITFSTRPSLQILTGSLRDRFNQLSRADWSMSTDIEATFDLILNQAIKHNVPQEQMPTMIMIMSDMEFNSARTNKHTAFEMISEKYLKSGYVMPKIVFWNLAARNNNFPAQKNDKNVILLSGFSPSLLKNVLSGKDTNPYDSMLSILNDERYSNIY